MVFGPLDQVDKLWGKEDVWINNESYCFKMLHLKPGFTSSEHYHRIKKETFIVMNGRCFLYVKKKDSDQVYSLKEGEQITIQPGQIHRFWLGKDATENCIIYEISTRHSDEDVYRLEPSRPL